MLKTDCGTRFEIVMEAKFRERREQELEKLRAAPIVFAYSEGLVNIELKDGTIMCGQRLVVMHESSREEGEADERDA